MEIEELDAVLVPLGIVLMGIYHIWLVLTIKRDPRRTVIGLNAQSRRQWVISMMADPLTNGMLAVQTVRNSIMASTLLATAAITLCSILGVFVSSTSTSTKISTKLVYGNKTSLISAVKYFSIMLCFLVSFVCNVQAIRYYSHVSYLSTLPTSQGNMDAVKYVAQSLNRGSFFWSVGLRALYFSFPLFLWIFGPIPMVVCCSVMVVVLYFLDTTTGLTRQMHAQTLKKKDMEDVEVDVAVSNSSSIHNIDVV